ncbi:hypothetical protein [Pseudomonas sp. NBRC 111135]|uniref:hypothetical protein n=1 Tax=Pseudomonas sp. NBRC 111135 TaxID=1661050 RepID=UPI0006D45391|nr:hypothetical protein [Pseudomonas sp. NBRC 111135]
MSDYRPLAEKMIKRIGEEAAQFRKEGLKDASYVTAAVGILSAHLARAIGRIEVLESELKGLSIKADAIEERGLKYCGTWQRAMDYRRGDCVTHKGSLWTALKATSQAPEEAATDWQLSAKGAKR